MVADCSESGSRLLINGLCGIGMEIPYFGTKVGI